jgi:hypothetical protein
MTWLVWGLGCPQPEPKTVPEPTQPPSTTPAPAPTVPLEEGLLVVTSGATSLGTEALSANGLIQPRGEPTDYFFEYGPTEAYGQVTPTRSLGPRLAAHYTEPWDEGLGGWRGGSGTELVHQPEGFVRFSEPSGTDYNHMDGIGPLHLAQYFYPGTFTADYPSAALGGGEPDLRDARVQLAVRGVGWDGRVWWTDPSQLAPFFRGDELVWWAQVDATEAEDSSHMSNWAHTGFYLTDALLSGDWTAVDYTLRADTRAWSYAGQDRTQGRDVYVYHPLGEVLRDLDVDFFHLLLFVDDYVELTGSIDFDELHIVYRNHSLLLPSNGGALSSAPAGSTDPAALTDGYRHGPGHTWQSAPMPTGPLELVYQLEQPVVVQRVQVHNDPEWPSQQIEVQISADGQSWTPVLQGELPEPSLHGPNFDYLLASGLAAEASYVRVQILGGRQPERWGLGEIELFGTGATLRTDDDWYSVTEDISGLLPGQTYHYRLVARAGGVLVAGPDQVFTVPTGEVPEVVTGEATPIGGAWVRLTGVVNTLGGEGEYSFELGPDTSYGISTTPVRTGPEITPRTFSRLLDFAHPDLASLPSGTTVHWRLTLRGGETWHHGDDATFVVP